MSSLSSSSSLSRESLLFGLRTKATPTPPLVVVPKKKECNFFGVFCTTSSSKSSFKVVFKKSFREEEDFKEEDFKEDDFKEDDFKEETLTVRETPPPPPTKNEKKKSFFFSSSGSKKKE